MKLWPIFEYWKKAVENQIWDIDIVYNDVSFFH